MAVIVAFCSQKGGVGKSTLARALAAYLAKAKFQVRIADLDVQQGTSVRWLERRRSNGFDDPRIDAKSYNSVREALDDIGDLDVLVVDGYARSSEGTLRIAQVADLLVQPSNGCEDDCEPAVLVFYDLYNAGIDPQRMAVVLTRLTTAAEEKEGRRYYESADIPLKIIGDGLYQKRAYGQAQDTGRTVCETDHASLNQKAEELMEALVKEIVAARKRSGETKAKAGKKSAKVA